MDTPSWKKMLKQRHSLEFLAKWPSSIVDYLPPPFWSQETPWWNPMTSQGVFFYHPPVKSKKYMTIDDGNPKPARNTETTYIVNWSLRVHYCPIFLVENPGNVGTSFSLQVSTASWVAVPKQGTGCWLCISYMTQWYLCNAWIPMCTLVKFGKCAWRRC